MILLFFQGYLYCTSRSADDDMVIGLATHHHQLICFIAISYSHHTLYIKNSEVLLFHFSQIKKTVWPWKSETMVLFSKLGILIFLLFIYKCILEYFIFKPGVRPAHAWFLRIASVRECLYACVFACVCVCVRLRGYEQLVPWCGLHMIGQISSMAFIW